MYRCSADSAGSLTLRRSRKHRSATCLDTCASPKTESVAPSAELDRNLQPPVRGCQLCLALGTGVRTGTEQALPPTSEEDDKSYRIDETYINVKGKDRYLYRAVDSTGQTIDFLLTAKRDAASAKRFFRKMFSAADPVSLAAAPGVAV